VPALLGKDGFDRKRKKNRNGFAPAANAERAREAFRAVGFANVEHRARSSGWRQKDPRQFQTGIPGDTHDGDLRESLTSRRLQSFFAGIHAIFYWRDDQHKCRTGNGSGDFRKFRAIDGGSEGCAPLGGVFSTSKFSAGRISRRNSLRAAPKEAAAWIPPGGQWRVCSRLGFLRGAAPAGRAKEVAWVTRSFCARGGGGSSFLGCQSADRQQVGGFDRAGMFSQVLMGTKPCMRM